MGASASPGRAGTGRPLLFFLLVSALTLALDQATKALFRQILSPNDFVPLIGDWVGLRLVHNTASAFGLVQASWVPLAGGLLVSVILVAYVARGALARHPWLALPLALLLGGSLGNLADRLRFRAVTDFIDFRVWPVFNIADSAITVGMVTLAWLLLWGRPRGRN